MTVEEGGIIVNEENNDEGRSDHHKNLAGNNIPPTCPRNEILEIEVVGSPLHGRSWAERVKQTRVTAFA